MGMGGLPKNWRRVSHASAKFRDRADAYYRGTCGAWWLRQDTLDDHMTVAHLSDFERQPGLLHLRFRFLERERGT